MGLLAKHTHSKRYNLQFNQIFRKTLSSQKKNPFQRRRKYTKTVDPLMSARPLNESNGGASTSASDEAPIQEVKPLALPTPEEIRGQDIWNNCAVRSVASGVMGGGLGVFMGLFLGAFETPLMQETMSTRQQIIFQAKQMGRKSWSSCKAFAVMGFIFSAAECVVEKYRAKHDITNTVVAGCATGGAISARGGPRAACVGCAGFATFSVVIEKFLESRD